MATASKRPAPVGLPPARTGIAHQARRFWMPRVAASVPVVRHRVLDLLHAWDLDAVADDVALMLSELATNAVRHAAGRGYTVSVLYEAGQITVEVYDADAKLPQLREPDTQDEVWRGLGLVAALAKDWGAAHRQRGKTVWFTLSAPLWSAPVTSVNGRRA